MVHIWWVLSLGTGRKQRPCKLVPTRNEDETGLLMTSNKVIKKRRFCSCITIEPQQLVRRVAESVIVHGLSGKATVWGIFLFFFGGGPSEGNPKSWTVSESYFFCSNHRYQSFLVQFKKVFLIYKIVQNWTIEVCVPVWETPMLVVAWSWRVGWSKVLHFAGLTCAPKNQPRTVRAHFEYLYVHL